LHDIARSQQRGELNLLPPIHPFQTDRKELGHPLSKLPTDLILYYHFPHVVITAANRSFRKMISSKSSPAFAEADDEFNVSPKSPTPA
jgi:hypothetical protein